MASNERPVIRFPRPSESLEFTGERFTPGTVGEIEHEHHHRYLFALGLCAGRDVLDVASGEGYGSALLATVARSVIGVELAPEVVSHAARSYTGSNLNFRAGDCTQLPIETASVDVVVSFETVEHVAEQGRFLGEIRRVLRPNGLLLMSSPIRGVYSVEHPNPFHVRELTRDELRELVGSHFRNAVYLGQTPVIGSALLADDPVPQGVSGGQLFWRQEDGGFRPASGFGLSPYLVIVASDGPLPTLQTSLLQDRPYMARLLGDLEDRSRSSAQFPELERRSAEISRSLDERDAEVRRLAAELETRESVLARREVEVQELREALETRESTLARREAEVRELREALDHARRPRGVRRLWTSLLRRLVIRRISTSGLFDVAYYLTMNPDVGGRTNPVRHYVKFGAVRGRNPHRMFETSYYLEQNPEVARTGINPLLHFIVSGAARGLRPHPRYSAREYLIAAADERTIVRPAPVSDREEPSRSDRRGAPGSVQRFEPRPIDVAPRRATNAHPSIARSLVVSHVLPFPPRAGNEYRIHRLLRWLGSIGHEVHLVVSPLPGDLLDPGLIRRAALEYPNLVVCERDGAVLYSSERDEVRSALASLRGEHPRSFPPGDPGPDRTDKILAIERTFCPDALLDVLSRLAEAIRPDVVISSYVFMSRCLPVVGGGALKVIDTHDVFSTKARKVVRFGVPDDLAMSSEEEGAMLRRADLVVAIQPDEERELGEIAPDRRVVTAGVDFELAEGPPSRDPVVLYVASNNAMNVKGIRDFLSIAWPLVRREMPQARLRLVGPICEAVDGDGDGIELLGRVDQLDAAYAEARVVINPSIAGTGLKIKTLEALSRLRPIVAWPSGVDGLGPEAKRFCHVARDWYDFSRQVVRLLSAEGAQGLAEHRDEIALQLSPGVVYAALRGVIEEGLARRAAPLSESV